MPITSPLPDESPVVDLEYGRIVNVSDEQILDDIAAWEQDVEELCALDRAEELAMAFVGDEYDDYDDDPDPDALAEAEDDDEEEWIH